MTTTNLKKYVKAWKELLLVPTSTSYSNFKVYYIQKGELVKVWRSDFYDVAYNEYSDTKELIKILKKSDKMPAYARFSNDMSKDMFTFQCSAIWTSRPLEIVLAIGGALWLWFHQIKQNYRVL